MKQWLIITIFIIATINATALEMCSDNIEINTNCTMVTPVISCVTYNYQIYNTTNNNGEIIENKNLTLLNNSIYYFNFTQPQGNYLVRLCDDTTREVKVESEKSKMIIAAIIIIPMLLGLFMLLSSFFLGEEHRVLKIGLFLLSFIPFFTSMHFGMLSVVKFFNFPELQEAIGSTVYWTGISFTIVITYFIIYLFHKAIRTMGEKKAEELEY